MAATVKHRRSGRRRRTTRGADRYSKVLTRAKKIKKFGGSFLTKSKITGEFVPSHRASEDNPSYKNVKVIRSKSEK